MTKHSKSERARRAAESERIAEIERAWKGSVPTAVAKQFELAVAAAIARGPAVPPPDMAPGTAPRPPRPGREPKPKKEEGARAKRY